MSARDELNTMAEVMQAHFIDITQTSPDNAGHCVCGGWADGSMSISWDEHLAEALTEAGYGKMERAWDEGFRACNGEWEQTADLVTPDEDRFIARNPYKNVTK